MAVRTRAKQDLQTGSALVATVSSLSTLKVVLTPLLDSLVRFVWQVSTQKASDKKTKTKSSPQLTEKRLSIRSRNLMLKLMNTMLFSHTTILIVLCKKLGLLQDTYKWAWKTWPNSYLLIYRRLIKRLTRKIFFQSHLPTSRRGTDRLQNPMMRLRCTQKKKIKQIPNLRPGSSRAHQLVRSNLMAPT